MSNSLKKWLDSIASHSPSRIRLDLSLVKQVADAYGLSRFSCPVVTVAGTNGKGSCVAFLEQILVTSGYRVASYYSPHLMRFNERIRIQGKEVEDEVLLASFEAINRLCDCQSLSFFEFTTLAAFHIFHSCKPEVVLLEVGLGGRQDAVNTVDADVAVITSISLDHKEYLGEDREAIGYEKSGIFRPGKLAICGDFNPPKSLMNEAQKAEALLLIGHDFSYQTFLNEWNWAGVQTTYKKLPLPHLKYQNAATSLMVIESLQTRLPVGYKEVVQGLKQTVLAGRFQSFFYPVKGFLDVAHNPDSARYLAQQISRQKLTGKVYAVVSMLKDKDIAGTIEPLLPLVDDWSTAALNTERSADPDQIVSCLTAFGVKNCYNFNSIPEALSRAIQVCAGSGGWLLVYGSFYTVAAAIKFLKLS